MVIYSVTVNIDESVHEEWLQWMKSKHIPDVMNTGCFSHHYFAKVLTTQPDETGHTYSIQYHASNQTELENYQNNHAAALQKEHLEKYQGHFVAFRTILEKV